MREDGKSGNRPAKTQNLEPKTQIALEIGRKRVIASALAWPGWARVGRDEQAALETLCAYGPRYQRAIGPAMPDLRTPERVDELVVVERLGGDATTDYGVPVVAPQRPVRAQGGFIQFGFPLSRIFDADPKGRNAGWTAFLYYGDDQAMARDARRFGARGTRSDLFSGNIQYKWNQWVTFGYEQGYYRTRADNRAGALPLFRGIPSFTTHNIRSEFAAIFTF